MKETMKIKVKIPKQLNCKKLKAGLSTGLYCLAIGESAVGEVPTEDPITATLTLNKDGKKYFEELLPEFESQRALIREALAVVQELPEECRCTI